MLFLFAAPAVFAQKPELVIQSGHLDAIYSVAFSSDGQSVASGSRDGTVKIRDALTGSELRTLVAHAGGVRSVAFRPGALELTTGGADRTVKVWDAETGALKRTLTGFSAAVRNVAYSPDGKLLAVMETAGEPPVIIYDATTLAELRRMPTKLASGAEALAFSPDGKTLAVAGYDQIIKLLDTTTGAELQLFKGHTDKINALSFSPDGESLASASEDNTVRVWSVASGQNKLSYAEHRNDVNAVVFAPDGARIASGGYTGSIKIWEAKTGTTITTLSYDRNRMVEALSFSADGQTLLGGYSLDNAVVLWNVADGKPLRDWPGRSKAISKLAFAPDGRMLLFGRPDRQLGLWDLTSGELRSLNEQQDGLSFFSLSPDGQTVAGLRDTNDGAALTLWEVSSGREKRRLLPPRIWPTGFLFSPDGKLIAGGGREGDDKKPTHPINIWDAQTGALLRKLKGYETGVVRALAFSPDGRLLASIEGLNYKSENAIKLWDTGTGAEVRVLAGHERNVSTVAFSADGKLLASGSADQMVKLWDVAGGSLVRTLAGHTQPVLCVAFSTDGKVLASGAGGGSVPLKDARAELKLWDTATGRELFSLEGHTYDVRTLAFSPDGRLLASGSGDGTIKLWDTSQGVEVATLTVLNERDWIVTTPAGLFDSAKEARPFLLWRYSSGLRDVVALDAFAADFHSPKLLAAVIANKDLKPPPALTKAEITARVQRLNETQKSESARRDAQAKKAAQDATPTDERPRLFLQTGHVRPIVAITLSPDGRVIASASEDQTIKLWDVETGHELRQLKSFAGDLGSYFPNRLIFAQHGKLLAAGSKDEITLWDTETGSLLRRFEKNHAPAFNRDATLMASLERGKIILRRPQTGELVREITLKVLDEMNTGDLALSPDGAVLASLSDQGITLRKAENGAQLRIIGKGAKNGRLGFSPDGSIIASLQDNTLKLWDVSTGDERASYTPQPVKTKDTGQVFDNRAYTFSFANDGQSIALGTLHGVEVWDVKAKQLIRRLPEDPFAQRFDAVAFSSDGRRLIAGSLSGIYLWDAASGKELARLTQSTERLIELAFSTDGRRMATEGKTTRIWDLTAGAVAHSYKGGFNRIVFAPDGKSLVRGFLGVDRLDVDSGTSTDLSAEKVPGTWQTEALALSPDGKLVAGIGGVDYTGPKPDASKSGRIRLVNTETNTEVRLFGAESIGAAGLVFSPDGKLLASGDNGLTTRLWEVKTGRLLYTMGTGQGFIANSVAFSPAGDLLASGSGDELKLWEVKSGTLARVIEVKEGVRGITFSRDGRFLAGIIRGGAIRLWSPATGEEFRTLAGHVSDVRAISFSPDSKTLASVGSDDTAKLWDAQSGEELATIITASRDEWLVVTPDGLFDGTPGTFSQIQWRFSARLFDVAPVELFFNDFYYPGLLGELFAGRRPRAKQSVAQLDRRQPQVHLTLANDQTVAGALNTREVKVKLDLTNAPAGAQDVRLFRNGSLTKVWHGDALNGQQSVTLEASIPIVAGQNRLVAYAFNHDNVKSSDATLVVSGADSLKRQGTAYILVVGVNVYRNQDYNLKYAVADAQEFSAEVKRRLEAQKRYAQVETISLLDAEATKANIMQRLSQLTARVQPEDTVIVYFAGHGTAAQKRFYLIPHDLGYEGPRDKLNEAGLQAMLAHSISDLELDQAFEKIDAGQLLLVIDACNSGQALEAEEKRRGPMNSKGLAQLAYEKGMYILTAAQSYQAAQEAAKFGHGFLTYALVEDGLKQGAADREPQDGRIDLREWLNYATDKVPQMQEANILEALRGRGIRINFAGDGTAAEDPGKTEVQRPRIFYRRELETNPLVVAILGAAAPR